MSTKDEIFVYVNDSPENTNPAVLRSLLNSLEGADLPIATEDTLGGVKVGSTLSISEDGTLNLQAVTKDDAYKCLKVDASGKWALGTGPQKTINITVKYDTNGLVVTFPTGTSRSSLYGYIYSYEANSLYVNVSYTSTEPSFSINAMLTCFSLDQTRNSFIFFGYAKGTGTDNTLYRIILGINLTYSGNDFIDVQPLT